MKKRIIQNTFIPTEDNKFIISRKTDIDKKDNFPFSFSNDYEIIIGGKDDTVVDPRDTFNNYNYYRKIPSEGIPGLDKSLFPELNLDATSYLTNTGIVAIFTGKNMIIYDILLGDDDDFYSITTSSINNFFNTNDNNPKNHKYIAIKKRDEGKIYAILDEMMRYKGKYKGEDYFYHYFYSDMDLLDCDSFDGRDISSDYERDSSISNDLFIEKTKNSSFNKYSAIVRLAKRQMFVIQSNFSDLKFYINDTILNPLERVDSEIELTLYNAMPEASSGIYQYIIDIAEENGKVLNDGEPYIDFSIKYTTTSEKGLEGWLEVF